MNNLSYSMRTFNRFELKYLLTLQQAERFKSDLRNFLVPDEHSGVNGRSELTSLYYDLPDLRCYYELVVLLVCLKMVYILGEPVPPGLNLTVIRSQVW
jgi:hypothetical protein